MTNAELIDKIKAEIERLCDEAPTCDDTIAYLMKVECFLDTLESEKPMELEEEIKRYYSDNFEYISSDQPTLSILTNIARHFAEWGYLRAAEKYNEIEYNRQRAEEPVSDDLGEAAEAFAFKSLDDVVLYGCTLSGRRACFIAGAKWDRQQMMKEAVEGTVHNFSSYKPHPTVLVDAKGFNQGDKVSVIVLPKED